MLLPLLTALNPGVTEQGTAQEGQPSPASSPAPAHPGDLLKSPAGILSSALCLNTPCAGEEICLQFKYQEKPFPESVAAVAIF